MFLKILLVYDFELQFCILFASLVQIKEFNCTFSLNSKSKFTLQSATLYL